MDLPELFLRKSHEETYANIGKTEEQIRNLITRDKKFQKGKLRSEPSRDISHLKDQKKTMKKIPPLPLPTDITHLRSLMQTSNSRGIQIAVSPSGVNHLTCTHKECIERVVSHNSSRKVFSKSSSRLPVSGNASPILENFPLSDREPLGSPSGIQGIESLYEWFKVMKSQCEDDDSMKLIYTMCARELLRQVSVQSVLRGKLLKEIIEMQPLVFGRQWEKLNTEFQSYKDEQELFVQALEKKYKEEMARKDLETKNLTEKLRKTEAEKEEISSLLEAYKKALNNTQKRFVDSEELWRSRIISILSEVQKKHDPNKKFSVFELLKMKKLNFSDQDGEYKLIVEGLSLEMESEEVLEAKEVQVVKGEENKKRKLVKNFVFAVDQSIQVDPEHLESEPGKEGVNGDPGENIEKLLGNVENPEILPENPLKSAESEPIPEQPKPDNLLPPTDPDQILNSNQFPPILDPDMTPLDIPTMFLENSAASMNLYEDTENNPEMLIKDTIEHSNRIYEAPSYAEESKDLIHSPQAENSLITPPKKLMRPVDQITQTEEVLFQSYLSKLSQIEDIIASARPEEIYQIQSSIQYLLQGDISSEKNSPKRVSFKSPTNLKRPSSDKLAAIIEPIQKLLANYSPDLSKFNSSEAQKEIKTQVNDLVNSIHYLNSSISEKQRDLLSIERKIQQKSSILNILSNKKTLDNTIISEHRKSNPEFIDVSRIGKSINLKKKFSEKSEFFQTNVTPWDEGYEVGYGDGKIQGFIKALEKIQETDLTGEIDTDDIEINESRPVNKRKNSKGKLATRFMEFNFHVPVKAKVKKIHPGPIILEKFLNRSLDRIKMRSTLSRKNLNRILGVIYNIAVQRILSDNSTSLIIVTYDEFYSRYGLKSVCDKKFLEFIASIVSNSEYKRCLMFMRLIRYGELLSSYSYSKYSLLLYLGCFQFIHSSKLGIHFSSDEEDKLMVPLLRVNECIKEKLEFLSDKSISSSILNKIEQKSVPDPKKINVNGMVELELSLEITLDTYETFINSIWKGLSLCLKAMGQHGKHTILSCDFYIICRFLSKTLRDVAKEVAVEDIYLTCIKFNLTREVEVLKLIPSLSKNELFSKLAQYKESFLYNIDNLKLQDEKNPTYEPSIWRLRFEILENHLDSDLFLSNLAWAMYEQELLRLFPDLFSPNN